MINQKHKIKTVALCGSMMFAKEMLQIKKQLEARNLIVNIQEDADITTTFDTIPQDRADLVKKVLINANQTLHLRTEERNRRRAEKIALLLQKYGYLPDLTKLRDVK